VGAPRNDRYEPLPGLLSLPSFLYRKLGRRGRIAVKVGGGLFLIGVTVAAIVLVPRIAESNRERSAQERKQAAAAMAERRRHLIAEQRPHRARAAKGASDAAVVATLRDEILADARGRVAAGQLSGPPAKRAQCKPLKETDGGTIVSYDCLAVTSDLPKLDSSPGGVIGHPYRAVIDFPSRRLTWCKISGHAGEGGFSQRDLAVRIPSACSL
jgi:hypothetical protein